jgi:putative membrane protein
MMGWNWDEGAWLGMGVGMLLWVVLGVVVVWLIVRGLIALERTRSDRPTASGPDDILRERFARGEIDAEEFERRLTLLRSK